MKTLKYFFIVIIPMVLIACSSGGMGASEDAGEIENEGNNPDDIWLIPFNDLRDGGPGKDGIPSIDNPIFEDANSVFLSDDELIVGIKQGDVVSVREKSKSMEIISESIAAKESSFDWLDWDSAKMEGKFLNTPEREMIPETFKEQLIVELYSK